MQQRGMLQVSRSQLGHHLDWQPQGCICFVGLLAHARSMRALLQHKRPDPLQMAGLYLDDLEVRKGTIHCPAIAWHVHWKPCYAR